MPPDPKPPTPPPPPPDGDAPLENEGGGGEGGVGLSGFRYVIFFTTSRGARFFSNLENHFLASFAMQDSFFLNFGFAGFVSVFGLPPPPSHF